MQKSAQLRAIYAELRSAGVEAPASDLLKIANFILLTFSSVDSLDPEELNFEGRPFFGLPLDKAMDDGGWRILEFEARRLGIGLEELPPEANALFIQRLRKAMGPEW